MSKRTTIIIAGIAALLLFAVGRFTAPETTKTEVKTVEVEKVVTKVVHQKIFITEKPDGTKETTIVTDSNTDSKTNTKSTDDTKEVVASKSRTNISLLAGSGLPLDLTSPVYGVSVSKNVLGPITAGLWGLTNKTVGISVGLSF